MSTKTKPARKPPNYGGKPIGKKAAARAEATKLVPFHPLANMFLLMQGEAFDALVKDVDERGLELPIILHEGKILDGRNRYRACLKAGVAPNFHTYAGNDPLSYVVSANLHRRHLSSEQKRDLIAKFLKAKPELSDRGIGRLAKADGKTVASVRAEEETRAEIPHVEKRTDTKGREQPAKKAGKKGTKKAAEPAEQSQLVKVVASQPQPETGAPASDAEAAAAAKRKQFEVINGELTKLAGEVEPHGELEPSTRTDTAIASIHLTMLSWVKTDPAKVAQAISKKLEREQIDTLFSWLDQVKAAFRNAIP
jgi:hypothetical protein